MPLGVSGTATVGGTHLHRRRLRAVAARSWAMAALSLIGVSASLTYSAPPAPAPTPFVDLLRHYALLAGQTVAPEVTAWPAVVPTERRAIGRLGDAELVAVPWSGNAPAAPFFVVPADGGEVIAVLGGAENWAHGQCVSLTAQVPVWNSSQHLRAGPRDMLVVLRAVRPAHPALVIDTTNRDLGTLALGAAVDVVVDVENAGEQDLVVQASASCASCTSVPRTPLTIGPHQSAQLPLRYTALTGGPAESLVKLTTNDPARPAVVIPLHAMVTMETQIRPAVIAQTLGKRDGLHAAATIMLPAGAKLTRATCDDMLLDLSLMPVRDNEAGSVWRVEIESRQSFTLGRQTAVIEIAVERGATPVLKLPVEVVVVPDLILQPASLIAKGSDLDAIVSLRHRSGAAFEVLSAKIEHGEGQCHFKQQDRLWTVRVTGRVERAEAVKQPCLVIGTNVPDEEQVRIPIAVSPLP